MLLRRFYDDKLAQASFLVGCPRSGEALVVDANRDVGQYVRAARAEGLRLAHVTETHIHADFVSGSRELAARAGARLYLSDEGAPDWRYGFAESARATPLRDGDVIAVGGVRIDVLHTPGHTPEHLTFLVTDTASADRPMGALTGDFIFVGDVGRPDLLERAAGVGGTMTDAARQLFRSLRRFAALPDYLQLWPGHGAGSACGKALGAVPQTTLGYERMFNWAFAVESEDEFVTRALEGQPAPPTYFARMKRVNRDGPPPLGELRPPRLSLADFRAALARGAVGVDTRPAASFSTGYLPGTINIPLNRAFTGWSGWLLPDDRDLVLVVDDESPDALPTAVRDLAAVGLDRVAGALPSSLLRAADRVETIPDIDAAELARRLADGTAVGVDVRADDEWAEGHLRGARHLPLGTLAHRAAEVPRGVTAVVHCQSGSRSVIGASVLRAAGVADVANFPGGFAEWERRGLPVERGATSPAPAGRVRG